MESIFTDQGVTSLELICLRNNTQVLCYFWPFYKLSLKDYKRSKSVPTSLSSDLKAFPNYNFSPIQLATIFGHIQVITTLYHGISDKSQIFYEIDLNAKEGKSGMNCALLAVKSGRLSVVKYLYYNYNCDFQACDASGCNAIDVAFMEHQIRPAGDYREIVCFLIDVVEVKFELKISYLKAIEQDLELKEYLERKYREMNTQDCDEEAGEDITIYSKGESSNDIGSSWNSAVQVSKEFGFRNPGRY